MNRSLKDPEEFGACGATVLCIVGAFVVGGVLAWIVSLIF